MAMAPAHFRLITDEHAIRWHLGSIEHGRRTYCGQLLDNHYRVSATVEPEKIAAEIECKRCERTVAFSHLVAQVVYG